MPARGRRRTDKFWYSLIYTVEGHLDLTWLFVFVMGLVASTGFTWEFVSNGHASIAAWSFMGTAFASVLIAAVPIAKARLLAMSRVPGEVARGIAASAPDGFVPHEWKTGKPDEGIL